MQLSVHPSQSVRFAMLLTLLGGYLDSFSLISFSGHLASLQSGNLIFMGISLLQKNYFLALTFLLPVICFTLGSATNYTVRYIFENHSQYFWEEVSLIAELFGFTIAAILAPIINHHFVILILAFFAGIQADMSTTIHGKNYTSLMTTGNLKTFGSSFAQFLLTKDREHLKITLHFTAIVSSFFTGAILAALSTSKLGLHALYALPIFLILALILTRQNFQIHGN